MEMHQLRYFVAVAETGSFTRAAEREGIAQPSLSQQIAKLETHLKRQLFDRLGRRVRLTEAGRQLLAKAQSILAAVGDAERILQEGDQVGRGRLAVGAIPTVAPYLLPPALRAFARRYPELELTVTEDFTERLTEATAAGDLDLAIMAAPVPDERLLAEPLLTEQLLVVMSPDHSLARRRKIGLTDLNAEPFIVLNEMH